MSAFTARSVEDGAVARAVGQDLALEDSAILQREMKDITLCAVGHRIEPHDSRGSVVQMQGIAHAPEVAMPSVQAAHTL